MISLRVHIFCCVLLIFVAFIPRITESFTINTSDLNENSNDTTNLKENVPDDEGILFDNYPMVAPKRAALLLDRLMVALHHVLEDDNKGAKKINDVYGGRGYSNSFSKSETKPRTTYIAPARNDDLDNGQNLDSLDISTRYARRAQTNAGRYWQCHFNPVTCF